MNRVRTALADVPDVRETKMFGSIAFMVRGKLCIGARAERLLCRIDPALHDEALKRKGTRTVVMRGREYRGYVHVDAEAVSAKRDLDYWVRLALDYNQRAKSAARKATRRIAPVVLACLALTAAPLHGQVCRPDSVAQASAVARPASYIFFRRDHERIAEPSFLSNPNIAGAQLTYTWQELEPERDRYDLRALRERLELLQRHGKRLVVQLQDVSFSDHILVPRYLTTDTAFHGGADRKYEGETEADPRFGGWVARRWDPAVRARFAKLLDALGRELDGRIEGIVIPETAIGVGIPSLRPAGFTFEGYVTGIQEITSAARRAFPRSCVIIYANFMPGEWRPQNDKGYLRSVYEHAERVGAGVGGPDLMPHRRGQRNHSYALIAARRPGIIAGVAVQDGNLAELNPTTGLRVTIDELYRFATDSLHLDFIFWGTEEPYYSSDVLPWLRALKRD